MVLKEVRSKERLEVAMQSLDGLPLIGIQYN
jgi:hypothetical protein